MNRTISRTLIRLRRGARAREGFAMFMALGALVIIGVLVAGSSFITLQETRLGQNSIVQTRAFAVAEYGLNKIQADWDKTPNLTMPNGTSFETGYSLGVRDTANVRYTRLNNETFWIVSEGRAFVGDGSAQRTAVKRVGAILRLRIPTINTNASITANGSVTIKGSVDVIGTNTTPTGWDGCSGGEDKVGIVVPTDATVTVGGDATNDQGYGTTDVASNPDTYVKYGDETWETLVLQANHTVSGTQSQIQPSSSGGACNRADPKNWGEPWKAPETGVVPECDNYFPIIYATGDMTVTGRRGQGILLVNGNLTINGDMDWYGLIIVKNDLVRGSGNAKIFGGVMAANERPFDDTNIQGGATYAYSSCALERAMRGSAQVTQAMERAWAELYD